MSSTLARCFLLDLLLTFFRPLLDFFVYPAASLSNDGGRVNGGKVGIEIVGRFKVGNVGKLIVGNVGKVCMVNGREVTGSDTSKTTGAR